MHGGPLIKFKKGFVYIDKNNPTWAEHVFDAKKSSNFFVTFETEKGKSVFK